MKTVICAQCDKEKILTNKNYRRGLSKGNKHFFCDNQCFYKFYWPNGKNKTICDLCGKVIPRKSCHVLRRGNKHSFCSTECFRIYSKNRPKNRLKPIMSIMSICPICKKERLLSLGERNQKKTDYCASCYSKYTNKKEKITCSNCGKEYWVKRNKAGKSKNPCCNNKCRIEFLKRNNKTVSCDNCGKQKEIILHYYKKYTHHFCNRKCFNAYSSRIRTKYTSVKIRDSARLMGVNHNDIKKYDLQEILEIHALNKELKKLLKGENLNGKNGNHKHGRRKEGADRSNQRCA